MNEESIFIHHTIKIQIQIEIKDAMIEIYFRIHTHFHVFFDFTFSTNLWKTLNTEIAEHENVRN